MNKSKRNRSEGDNSENVLNVRAFLPLSLRFRHVSLPIMLSESWKMTDEVESIPFQLMLFSHERMCSFTTWTDFHPPAIRLWFICR